MKLPNTSLATRWHSPITMQSNLGFLICVVALGLPLACSETSGDDPTGAGGNGAGASGAVAGGGSSASGGATNSGGMAGMSGIAGVTGISGMAGAAGMAGMTGDDRRFVPEDLTRTDRDGAGGLELIAFTLVQRATGAEFYVAVRNDGQVPVCEGGMMTDFIDEAGAIVTTGTSVLLSGELYRFDDGSGVIVSCITPGGIAMAVSTEIPVVVAELGALEYGFPAFPLDGIVPVDGLTVSDVETVSSGTGTAYTGTLTNGLDGAVSNPKVTIFPVNRVGRPLGAATSSATTDVPAGGSWTFETTTVDDAGVDSVAYPAASIPQ